MAAGDRTRQGPRAEEAGEAGLSPPWRPHPADSATVLWRPVSFGSWNRATLLPEAVWNGQGTHTHTRTRTRTHTRTHVAATLRSWQPAPLSGPLSAASAPRLSQLLGSAALISPSAPVADSGHLTGEWLL